MRTSRLSYQKISGFRGKGTGMNLQRLVIAFALAVSLTMLGTMDSAMAAPKCDRQCLVDLMQKYIGALANHDPKELPFAEKVKFTENSEKTVEFLEVGKGLWENATGGPTEFQIYAADPEAQAAACLVVMKEKDKDVLLGARIKLENGKITEAEHLLAGISEATTTNSDSPFANMPPPINNLQTPRPGLLTEISEESHMDHDQLAHRGSLPRRNLEQRNHH